MLTKFFCGFLISYFSCIFIKFFHQLQDGRSGDTSGEEDNDAVENADEAESDAELTLLNQSTDSLNLSISSDGVQTLSECSAELDLRPKLILNIMSGPNHENSVVMGHEEIETGEEHDKFHDVPNSVILRHPRVPPLHG